jgi:spoIIIJ-associated protein
VVATEQDAERLAELLREIVSSAELDVSVTPAGVSGRYVNLVLDGKDVAFLVGKHGEVLNALQYLVNIIGNRKLTAGVRATLDGNDYRKRREDTLTQLAVNIAAQVKKRGEEAVLDALPAFERRIVHKALSTVTGISTYSEGEEPNRRVIIAPAT